jgi:hypothetical protein
VTLTDTSFNPLENGLTSHSGTTAANGSPPALTDPSSQGQGSSQFSLHPILLIHAPFLHSKALVKRHHASLVCHDSIKIIHTSPQEIYFPCPWRQQYELLPTYLRRIIGPCPAPPPPECLQQISSLTRIRSASDESVLHAQRFQGLLTAKLNNKILVHGFGATDGCIEDVSSRRAEICGNIATFTILTLIRKVYGFFPPSIQHICDNKSDINATWKDGNISVFEKTKPDADVAKVARLTISDIQQHSQVNAFWIEGHADKCGPPFSPQE